MGLNETMRMSKETHTVWYHEFIRLVGIATFVFDSEQLAELIDRLKATAKTADTEDGEPPFIQAAVDYLQFQLDRKD